MHPEQVIPRTLMGFEMKKWVVLFLWVINIIFFIANFFNLTNLNSYEKYFIILFKPMGNVYCSLQIITLCATLDYLVDYLSHKSYFLKFSLHVYIRSILIILLIVHFFLVAITSYFVYRGGI